MIRETRKTLFFIYSAIIGSILIIMAVSFYLMLSGVLARDEHIRLEAASAKAQTEWQRRIMNRIEGNNANREIRDNRPHRMEWEFLQSNQAAVVSDQNGQILSQSLGRNPLVTEGFMSEIKIPATNNKPYFLKHMEMDSRSYAVISMDMENIRGIKLYMAEDVSNQKHLLAEMRWLLGGVSILLLVVASIIGYILSGRAMIPITRSYERQKAFTADASHELRTPLSVLQASMEILEEQKQQLPSIHQVVMGHMKDEIHRMIRLTENLLLLARNDSAIPLSQLELFDLRQTIVNAIDRMQLAAQAKQIVIKAHVDGLKEGLSYKGDADQISQLLYILLDNAVKFSDMEGSVIVQSRSYAKRGIEITITDKGCGIPAQDIPHVFERFYRVDKARSRESGGTGLGLSIASRIVHNHGGELAVTSTMDQGSIFIIRIPEMELLSDS
ncbi:cell wall metabolism sensor histidine kinase WalK [Paenibacillus sp. 1_12]|uniref:sensor histidine kinase n=1 Tax=Paenibacillus sp. 1_12 TaxID=1566278 RepID=UPI000A72F144|nr:ATP-binding protein [Paenibacillus sp. 1_12]